MQYIRLLRPFGADPVVVPRSAGHPAPISKSSDSPRSWEFGAGLRRRAYLSLWNLRSRREDGPPLLFTFVIDYVVPTGKRLLEIDGFSDYFKVRKWQVLIIPSLYASR